MRTSPAEVRKAIEDWVKKNEEFDEFKWIDPTCNDNKYHIPKHKNILCHYLANEKGENLDKSDGFQSSSWGDSHAKKMGFYTEHKRAVSAGYKPHAVISGQADTEGLDSSKYRSVTRSHPTKGAMNF